MAEATSPVAATHGIKRHISGQRLSLFIIIMILLYFTISAYIQSSQNEALLKAAIHERSQLISSSEQLSNVNKRQTERIARLLIAIDAQNKELRSHGLPIVVVKPAPLPTLSPRPTITTIP